MSAGELNTNYSANLQGLWHLSGTTDSSKNGYNLTNVNTSTFVPGKFNNCAKLVAASAQCFTSSGANLNVTTSQTWMCWVNFANTGAEKHILGIRNSAGGNLRTIYSAGANNDFRFFISGLGVTEVTHTTIFTPGLWYSVVGRYDSAANTLAIFVNGVKVQVATSGSPSAVTGNFAIGRWGDEAGSEMNGLMDEVAIFNAALTDAQITNYYAWAKGLRTSTA